MDVQKKIVLAVLVLPIDGNEMLLARKKLVIGVGQWNGWGGKIETGETAKQAAVREFTIETGGATLQPDDLLFAALIDFTTVDNGQRLTYRVHIYTVSQWQGEIRETAEMGAPHSFPISALPFDNMMPADRHWLPAIFDSRPFTAKAIYGPGQKELLQPVVIRFVDRLEG